MARPSAIYRSSQQSNLVRTKYKFPILDPQELVMLYDTMGFEISESLLTRPTSSFMKSLIEQIMDKFLYISPYSLREKVMKIEVDYGYDDDMMNDNGNTNDDQDNENDEITGQDVFSNNNATQKYDIRPSISIVACQRIMYKFLCDCGVDDFSIRDVSKPESGRLRIILSALINYARFREERMGDFDELMDKNDKTLEDYKQLINKNKEYKNQIEKITMDLNNQDYTLDELYAKNQELENQLRDLRMIQKQLTADHEKYRNEKVELLNELENQSALYIETEKDLEEVRPYIKESPESIKDLIQKMKESEIKELETLKNLEQKFRNITISLDSFQLLIQELNNLHKILDELKIEATRSKTYDDKLKSLKNQTVETEEQANEYNRKMLQIERQLKHNEDRISKLQTFYSEKMKSLDEKIATQITEFSAIKSEKNLEDVDLSEKEAQINDWMSKIAEYERRYKLECKEANFELEKLNSKVLLYISEINNKIKDSKDLLSI